MIHYTDKQLERADHEMTERKDREVEERQARLSDTPETDDAWLDGFTFDAEDTHRAADFARNMERQRNALAEALQNVADDLSMELGMRMPNPDETWCSLRDAREALTRLNP